MKKALLTILVLTIFVNSWATKFYVDPLAGGTNSGTLANPWLSVSAINQSLIQPGDSLLFRTDRTYTSGQINFNRSGTAGNFITISTYGGGTKPLFWGNGSTLTSLFYLNNRSWVIIDGLNITDTTISSSDRSVLSKIQRAVYLDGTTSNVIIRNCNFDRVGLCAFFVGGSNYFTQNQVQNLRMIVNGVSPDNDYGANGVVVSSNNNVISYNSLVGCWATSIDYGYDGGAVEFFGSCSNNQVTYNYIYDCLGVCEFGSSGGGTTQYTRIGYNVIINSGGSYCNMSGTFATQVKNIQYYNNVMLDSANRWGETYFFSYGGTATYDTVFDLRNNIFYSRTGLRVKGGSWPSAKITHINNVYNITGGGTIGYTTNPGEITSTVNNWVKGNNPMPFWDFNLVPTAPAANTGASLGGLFYADYYGTVIGTTVSIGVAQFVVTPTPPPSTNIMVIKSFYNRMILKPAG